MRSGLEMSEFAASRPPVGSSRRIGTASQRMTGMMMNGATTAMPANIAIVIAIAAVRGEAAGLALVAEPERPAEPDAGEEQREPDHEPALGGGRRTWALPRTARIGEMRPARRAGQ